MIRQRTLRVALIAVGLLVAEGTASAARVVIHFAPEALCPGAPLKPDEALTGTGDIRWHALCKGKHSCLPTPTCVLTFTHPCTGQAVAVPLYLPAGTPNIEHVYRRIVYNYGSYTVEVRFLPDGSVDVIYNSGLLRAL
jgi:hypothetical protein